ncbi:MAG: PepSY domain-containing protein [Aestuariivirga sp.]|uniref:PepSY domain-containing protein n=1 Tax=Aestuariivirga sp. TaxID=2650926 RepID=UPI0025C2C8E5|nr:PepSY domain-containing protein [Aestuariivirga sp.]MCA3562079.1 PepSY domain-containing protein [Aestuariivirga sp.]
MIRLLHRWPGLLALLSVLMLALSGAALSVFPAADRLTAPQAETSLSVADLAGRIAARYPGVEQIKRSPSGRITAYWFNGDVAEAATIDPATGKAVASADPNPVQRWLTNFHRSLFLEDGGRIVMALGALAMLVLAVSGMLLVARRAGGWRRWFAPIKGPLAGRLHVEIARIAVVGLMLSSVTALYMTASAFGLLPDQPAALAIPATVSGNTGVKVSAINFLQGTPVTSLRELSVPAADDATDVFTVKTDTGTGYIDQGNGALLAWQTLSGWERVSETIYMLHTGQGASVLGLVLGLMALSVPLMGATGTLIWLAGRRSRPRIHNNAPLARADTVILAGSEGGSTWGFAATLHKALHDAGLQVHAAALSSFDAAKLQHAHRVLILAATYGNGGEPASAKGFLAKLEAMETPPAAQLAVLGFGDSSFPAFCGYAQRVASLAAAKGWQQMPGVATVDRQSPQDFARWGSNLGAVLGLPLSLEHQPVLPAATAITLVSRRDYGAEVQAPSAILRFAVPKSSLWQRLAGAGFARFEAGDLLGVIPQGSTVPRFYSLASASDDGFIEIVVRRQPGGLCSGQLTMMEPGGTALAFLKPNPAFRVDGGKVPVILVGAGSGIGPLAGFIRANAQHRAMHLFFGMRHAASDFLYGEEMMQWHAEGRLTSLVTAASRGRRPHYVQDALRAEAQEVVKLIREGARIMVCGGRGMAAGVSQALAHMLAPTGLTPELLRAEGRYAEDVY